MTEKKKTRAKKPRKSKAVKANSTDKTVKEPRKRANKEETSLECSKNKAGRPTKYDPKYCQEIIEFFDREYTREVEVVHTNKKGDTWSHFEEKPNDPPHLGQFAHKLGVNRSTLWEWAQKHPDFSKALTRAKEMAEDMVVNNAMRGFYNPNFTALVMKNRFGWKDKKETEHSGKVGQEIEVKRQQISELSDRELLEQIRETVEARARGKILYVGEGGRRPGIPAPDNREGEA